MSYELPPGFRFHPTDEELIVFYLCNQAASQPCPAPIIPQLNVYRFEPWDLPGKSAGLGEREWYFFTPRGRKYPNGMRPNRATATGYWKATGTDKPIHSGSARVGVKKALVFYQGRPPKGRKTDWIMHEYRLCGSPSVSSPFKAGGLEDEWVLCRIYQKRQQKRDEEKAPEFPRSCSLACLMEPDYAQLFSDSAAASVDDLFACCGNAGGWDLLKA